MLPVIVHNGKLYIGDHVLLQLHANIADSGVPLKRPFVSSCEDGVYICGFLSKSRVENIVSTGDTEDCGRIRALFACYRKETGERTMPVCKIKEKDNFTPMRKKIRVKFRVKRLWKKHTQ